LRVVSAYDLLLFYNQSVLTF